MSLPVPCSYIFKTDHVGLTELSHASCTDGVAPIRTGPALGLAIPAEHNHFFRHRVQHLFSDIV